MLLAVVLIFWFHPALWVLFALLVPMLLDGGIQALTAYESTNLRRLLTGFLFGYAFFTLLFLSFRAAFLYGVSLGETLSGSSV